MCNFDELFVILSNLDKYLLLYVEEINTLNIIGFTIILIPII